MKVKLRINVFFVAYFLNIICNEEVSYISQNEDNINTWYIVTLKEFIEIMNKEDIDDIDNVRDIYLTKYKEFNDQGCELFQYFIQLYTKSLDIAMRNISKKHPFPEAIVKLMKFTNKNLEGFREEIEKKYNLKITLNPNIYFYQESIQNPK